ncbi:MAG: hypothetical protein ACR2PK_01595 [Acidimicrobiales bacterium]
MNTVTHTFDRDGTAPVNLIGELRRGLFELVGGSGSVAGCQRTQDIAWLNEYDLFGCSVSFEAPYFEIDQGTRMIRNTSVA